ncbi:hypothetical protein OED52_13665 [Rhodococcus sp. Z13]|uniref:Uncharacterized protein n=1 Tax=Rhodococcus sacchari TaxID=2962047 RepID=A0ACD4DCL6_9NOCA|nr:hypothetical protein [Rhodococcus sp. Z13]UYP17719.1 hypothetical protein OED52_13665 [Rhodococcus sp. Z13]
MSQYILGLATLPIAAGVIVAAYFWGRALVWAIKRWWLSPTEFSSNDWGSRARHASCVFAARRCWAVKLPGSRLLVYRSTVGGSDYTHGEYYTDTDELRRRAASLLLDEFDPR